MKYTLFIFLLLGFCSTTEIKNPIVDELSEQVNSFEEKTRNFVNTKYTVQEDKSKDCEELLISGTNLTTKLKKELVLLNNQNISLTKDNSELAIKAEKYEWWRNRFYAALAILIAWEFRSFIWKFIQKAML